MNYRDKEGGVNHFQINPQFYARTCSVNLQFHMRYWQVPIMTGLYLIETDRKRIYPWDIIEQIALLSSNYS